MTGWTEYTLALVAFTASHFVPRIGDLRGRLIGRVGRRAYFSVYGLLSLALLVWVIVAAGRAPFVEVWPQAPWTRCSRPCRTRCRRGAILAVLRRWRPLRIGLPPRRSTT